MNKVYSFRLSDENPRESQAREVIEAWVRDGFSLKHLIVDALLALSKDLSRTEDLAVLIANLEKIVMKLQGGKFKQQNEQDETELSMAFISTLKTSVKSGLGSVK